MTEALKENSIESLSEQEKIEKLLQAISECKGQIYERAERMGAEIQEFWQANLQGIKEENGYFRVPKQLIEELIKKIHRDSVDDSDKITVGIKIETYRRFSALIDNSQLFSDEGGELLASYFGHDISRAGPSSIIPFLNHLSLNPDNKGNVNISAEKFDILRNLCSRYGELVKFSVYPYDFLQAIIEYKQTGIIKEQDVNLAEDILRPIVELIQARFTLFDFKLLIPPQLEGKGNRIIFNYPEKLSDLKINKGIMTSILYNLIKNAAKALLEQAESEGSLETGRFVKQAHKLDQVIKVDIKEAENHLVIEVLDSGYGISIDKLLKNIGMRLSRTSTDEDQMIRELQAIIGEKSTQILLAWPKNPFVIRYLTLGDIFDVTLVSRLGGFDAPPSSGLGLWGVNLLTKIYGGKVEGTNICGGGAIFRIMLPLTLK